MRGSEERDVMFGRLFGYLALIRSGRLREDQPSALHALDRLVGLHKRKVWIREVVSEAILMLLEELSEDVDVMTAVAKRLADILCGTPDLSDMSPHDIVLVSGLQSFCQSRDPNVVKPLVCLVSAGYCSSPLLSAAHLQSHLVEPLLTACAGFPKVHRVWSSLLLAIFGSGDFRCLPVSR